MEYLIVTYRFITFAIAVLDNDSNILIDNSHNDTLRIISDNSMMATMKNMSNTFSRNYNALKITRSNATDFYRSISLCGLLLVFPMLAFGSQYYVSPNGDNSNLGTLASPWKNINFAVSLLSAGDTLYVRGGIYAESVSVDNTGTINFPITIKNYSGERPIIDGTKLAVKDWSALMSINGSYVSISGFELRNMNLNGAVKGGYGLNLDGIGDTASNMLVHDIWSQAIVLQNDNQIVQDSTVYRGALINCRLPTAVSCGVQTSNYNPADMLHSGWPACISILKRYNSGAINHNSTVKGTTVYDCWGEGISTFNSYGATIEGNIIYNNFSVNLYVNNAQHAMVRRNIIYNSSDSYLGSYMPVAGGLSLADEQNNTLPAKASNLSEYNTVINNFILNSSISLYGWTEIVGSGLNNNLIANNTIINSSFTTGAGGPQNITNVDTKIVNNIVSGGTVTVPSVAGLIFSNNLWQEVPSVDVLGTDSLIGDPKLNASGSTEAGHLTSKYFTLQTESPAIGKGLSLTQVTVDFFGTPVTIPPNIGGYTLTSQHKTRAVVRK